MLKTRLAEKDAQLMGGFGALSNMHFGLPGGGLPDPEAIAATLPEQVWHSKLCQQLEDM